jgi:hypothetical protein
LGSAKACPSGTAAAVMRIVVVMKRELGRAGRGRERELVELVRK